MYESDLAYIHHAGFTGFAAATAQEVARLLESRRDIVEVGCGSGVLARHLTDRRHRYVGIDISPAMVRLARRNAPRGRFRVGSLTDAPLPPCDAVVALGEVVTYPRGGLRMLRRFFERVHRALRPRGVLLFDFMSSATARTFSRKSIDGDGWRIEVSARYDRRARTLTRRMRIERRIGKTVRRSRETHRVRIYDRRQIAAALRRAGFTVRMRRSLGRHRLLPGDVVVIARKRGRI